MDASTREQIRKLSAETKEAYRAILEYTEGDVDKFLRFLAIVRQQAYEEGRREGIAAMKNMLNRG